MTLSIFSEQHNIKLKIRENIKYRDRYRISSAYYYYLIFALVVLIFYYLIKYLTFNTKYSHDPFLNSHNLGKYSIAQKYIIYITIYS